MRLGDGISCLAIGVDDRAASVIVNVGLHTKGGAGGADFAPAPPLKLIVLEPLVSLVMLPVVSVPPLSRLMVLLPWLPAPAVLVDVVTLLTVNPAAVLPAPPIVSWPVAILATVVLIVEPISMAPPDSD